MCSKPYSFASVAGEPNQARYTQFIEQALDNIQISQLQLAFW